MYIYIYVCIYIYMYIYIYISYGCILYQCRVDFFQRVDELKRSTVEEIHKSQSSPGPKEDLVASFVFYHLVKVYMRT